MSLQFEFSLQCVCFVSVQAITMAGRGKGVRVEDWTAGDEVFLKSMRERRMNYFF